MDKCTLFCYFNKTVADEVVWCKEGKIPTALISVSFRSHHFFVSSVALKTYNLWLDKSRSCVVRASPSIPFPRN